MPKILLDSIDRLIVDSLREDGRLTNQDLADRVGLSPSPCLRRVRGLEERGVLIGYTAVVNARSLGLAVLAFARISLKDHSKSTVQEFEDAIRAFGEVQECVLVSGQSDYLLRILVEDLDAYERFIREKLHSISGIGSIDSSFAIGAVKESQGSMRGGRV